MSAVATAELDAIVRREHGQPHSILGAHPTGGGVVIRAFRPAARAVDRARSTTAPTASSPRSTPAASSRPR